MTTKNAKKFILQLKGEIFLATRCPEYVLEQVAMRLEICEGDCAKTGRCQSCNCPFGKMILSDEGCGSGRYPAMIESEDMWNKYKEANGIVFEE